MRKMKLVLLMVVISIVTLTSVAFAGFTDNEATFTSSLAPGYYLEDFSAYSTWSPLGTGPITFTSSNGFSYNITSTGGGLWGIPGGAISTEWNTTVVKITFTGAPVNAVGGQFFLSDYSGYDMNGQVNVTFSDGSSTQVTMSDLTRPFLGYSSNLAIASLSIDSVRPTGDDTYYPTIDHLYVGSQVPIPAAIWLLGTGLVGLFGVRRRFTS